MQADQIVPFIEATKDVFAKMLRMSVRFGKPTSHVSKEPMHDVSGIVGLSGDLVGVVVLTFPTDVAVKCVEALAGAPASPEGEEFADAIGEIANMVSGAAKARIKGRNLSIGCPSVVTGPGHKVRQITEAPSIRIPCMTDAGDFCIQVCIRDPAEEGAAAA